MGIIQTWINANVHKSAVTKDAKEVIRTTQGERDIGETTFRLYNHIFLDVGLKHKDDVVEFVREVFKGINCQS